ncbi:hypothetical protein ABZ347_37660, partial [Streptomyces sp. NPDC005953]
MSAVPGADETRVRGLLRRLGVGPDAPAPDLSGFDWTPATPVPDPAAPTRTPATPDVPEVPPGNAEVSEVEWWRTCLPARHPWRETPQPDAGEQPQVPAPVRVTIEPAPAPEDPQATRRRRIRIWLAYHGA